MSLRGCGRVNTETSIMTVSNLACRAGGAVLGAVLYAALAFAQSSPVTIAPLRTAPTEKFIVNPGVRDWGPTTIAGTTILGGNMTNRGGLFAVDTLTGKVKWTTRSSGKDNGSVSTAPVVSGQVVVTIMSNTVMAFSLATGKEVWRGPATMTSATVAVGADVAYVLGDDANFYALDAATGRERWKVAFRRAGSCHAEPVVRDGVVYVSAMILNRPADANRSAEASQHLFALDASTGKERWRFPEVGSRGGCLEQPVVTADTYHGVESQALYAVNLTTGRERWKPVEVRQPVDGRLRGVPIGGLVDAGSVLVGMTPAALIAFDKATGQTAWEVAGQFSVTSPSTAVAGRVLYFQGHPGATPIADGAGGGYSGGRPIVRTPALPPGKLNALDVDTRTVLWSFSRVTAEANWPFGFVTPVDGGLWVDSYQALVKLQ
jgi:outer membrane protein assembly factor BamB